MQEDIAPHLIAMIKGAMDELRVGDPWQLSTDVGPVIDAEAQQGIDTYLETKANHILHRVWAPKQGHFAPPVLLRVDGIDDLEREVFGPVLHVATFRAGELNRVIGNINARGFGLTFGLHTRIDSRVQEVTDAIHAGNIYVNRNQIGAVVGSQPFGGEGLSGTGPKAGGPHYLPRFFAPEPVSAGQGSDGEVDLRGLTAALRGATETSLDDRLMPGPTGELNRLSLHSRPPLLCLGPGVEATRAQISVVEAMGGKAVGVEGQLSPEALESLSGFSAVLWWGDASRGRAYARVLAARQGPIVPLICAHPDLAHIAHERHLCVDTTAAGGNAALLAG